MAGDFHFFLNFRLLVDVTAKIRLGDGDKHARLLSVSELNLSIKYFNFYIPSTKQIYLKVFNTLKQNLLPYVISITFLVIVLAVVLK